MSDVFSFRPSEQRFTHFKNNYGSRLDIYYVSNTIIPKVNILEVINLGISDHEPLILTLKENKIKRGHDLWSAKNCHTKEYTTSINTILDQDM